MRACLLGSAFALSSLVIGPSVFASEALTLEGLGKGNLLPNSRLEADSGQGRVRSWSVHPDQSPLIRPQKEYLELAPGAASLGLTSRKIKVEAGQAYTLAFDLKQENIHIGFGMGTRVMLIWYRGEGARTPESFDAIDGSFDWETRTFSVVAPEGAESLQVRLRKSGSPGTVFLRNTRLAKGVLMAKKEEMAASDFIKAEMAFRFQRTHLRDLMADKSALEIPGAAERLTALEVQIAAGEQLVQADLKARGLEISKEAWHDARWNEMLKGNVGYRMNPGLPYYEAWEKADREREAFGTWINEWVAKENTARLKRGMEKAFGVAPGYAVGVSSPMLKTRREAPYLGPVAAEASVALAREEEEGVQITIAALDGGLEKVAIGVGPLKNAEGVALPEGAVQVHRLDYVKTNPAQYYAAGGIGWWPDVVFPAREVAKVEQGENQAFWVTVLAGAKTPAGEYRGEVTISVDGKPAQTVALKVRVWDFALPRPGRFEVFGCFHPYMLKNFYRWDTIREDVVAEWSKFIVQKRWNPTLYFSKGLTPSGPPLASALQEGLNMINLLDPSKFLDRDESRTYSWPTKKQEEAIRAAAVKAKEEFLAAGGDLTKTKLYLSAFDEQHDRNQYPLMKHVFNVAKSAVPEAKTLTSTTYPPLGDLVGAVDTWVPLLGSESPDLLERQAAGDDVHFYVYAHPFRPFPNPSLIDYHGADARVTFWLAANKGYTGFFHYLFNGWKVNNELEGPRWPETPWLPYSGENQRNRNGAGYFLYPGPNGQPISSVRMELVREGIEDWEMIALLKERLAELEKTTPAAPEVVKARLALEATRAIAPELDDFTLEMGRIMAVREQVAEAILAISALQEVKP